jgi:hypothetical protein
MIQNLLSTRPYSHHTQMGPSIALQRGCVPAQLNDLADATLCSGNLGGAQVSTKAEERYQLTQWDPHGSATMSMRMRYLIPLLSRSVKVLVMPDCTRGLCRLRSRRHDGLALVARLRSHGRHTKIVRSGVRCFVVSSIYIYIYHWASGAPLAERDAVCSSRHGPRCWWLPNVSEACRVGNLEAFECLCGGALR